MENASFVELLPRTPRTTGPLFVRISSAESGIGFRHEWNPPERHRYAFNNSLVGGGVCIGDYDDDGWPDIYLTRPFDGNRLYRNLGDFHFEDVTARAGVSGDNMWGTGASFVDIDNDADLDLYVCGCDCPNRLFLNQGDGTFVEAASSAGLDYHGASVMMAFADYDRDGDLDAYLVTNSVAPATPERFRLERRNGRPAVPEGFLQLADLIYLPDGSYRKIEAGQYDHLYRNNGNGSFTDVTDEMGISGNHLGLSATWWDYNGDNWPDLYVANDFWGPDRLYRNNGVTPPRFSDAAATALPHTPWYSMGSDVADINNDGQLDYMSADMSGTTHFRRKMGMGNMENSAWFLEFPVPRQYMRNAVYLNTGTERFMEVAYLAGLADTDWTWSLRFEDLDSDGWVDLFVTNGMTRDWFNSDLQRRSLQLGGTKSPRGWKMWMDSPAKREANLAFRNLGDLRFRSQAPEWGLAEEGVSFGTALADLDRDGDLDIVVNNFAAPVSVFRNLGSNGHQVLIRLRGTTSNRFGIGAMIKLESELGVQSRYMTLARGYMSASEPLAHFGLGVATTIHRLSVLWPSGHVQQFTELPVDQLVTITEPAQAPTSPPAQVPSPQFRRSDVIPAFRHREKPFDDFAAQPLLPKKNSQLGPGLAWGDADGDGHDDLFVGGAAGQPGEIFRRENDRFVRHEVALDSASTDPLTSDRACEDMGALWFDADLDGDLDLYVASGGVEFSVDDQLLQDRLYLNDGRGRFTKAPEDVLPNARHNNTAVVAADFDRDGDLDIFVGGFVTAGAYPIADPNQLLRNDSSPGLLKFVDVTDDIAPGLRQSGLVTGAVWSDTDNDGWVDLLVTHEWGPVKLFGNDQGMLVDRTETADLAGRLGMWNGISARDIDNDGDIDYVVTNLGLNTKYHASNNRPMTLYYGDFTGSGRKCLVEVEFEGEKMFPMRGRSCSTNAVPLLAERFPTFQDFASSSLEEIYSPQRLSAADRFEVNSLESGCLVNDGTGRFVFKPLPRLAQVSPGFGTVLTEVDGDGYTDLYIVQNFFGAQPETGRIDGGVSLLLLGRERISASDSAFEFVMPGQSGLVVAGDAKAVTACDINQDGRVDFVVSTNDDELISFENFASHPDRMLTILLEGRHGNSAAVGSQVTLALSDGTRQTAETHAGSGYLSQSSRGLTFGLGDAQPKWVRTRWPDGSSSTHRESFPGPVMVIRQPK